MIVEIHGIDCSKLEHALRMDVFHEVVTDDVIVISAYKGDVSAHSGSYILRKGRVRVLPREPGELCTTVHGSARDILAILHILGISREPFLQYMKDKRSKRKKSMVIHTHALTL